MARLLALLAIALLFAGRASAEAPSPHAIEIPRWFSESFLDFREDARDAAREGKRLMVYFGQDGCPYCKALMKVTFGTPDIEAATRRGFVAVALNLWGDREVAWIDGRRMSEKELGRALEVQYTPTLIFLDEKGEVVLRVNGYQPPERFRPVLAYASLPAPRPTFAEYVAGRLAPRGGPPEAPIAEALGKGKPVLVVVTRPSCRDCEELDREAFTRPEVARLLSRFVVLRRDLAGAWARAHDVAHTPTLVMLDAQGKEAFRAEGYLRPFHLAAVLDYVASGAYRGEPSYQRYLQRRTEAMRARGETVDLWK